MRATCARRRSRPFGPGARVGSSRRSPSGLEDGSFSFVRVPGEDLLSGGVEEDLEVVDAGGGVVEGDGGAGFAVWGGRERMFRLAGAVERDADAIGRVTDQN